jgi:nucleoside-diphosphate-sugar epimerase
MRVLVTGGAGYIGSVVATQLAAVGPAKGVRGNGIPPGEASRVVLPGQR